MEIKSFTYDTALAEKFLQFAYDQYKDDSRYIPPMREEQRAILSKDNPYFGETGTTSRHFLAFRDGEVVGRVSAFCNPMIRSADGSSIGAVGLFECRQDYGVAQCLLQSAVDWFKNQFGIKRIWGPLNGSIWQGYRFMTRGFDDSLFVGEPYNPPYYPEYFARFGFHTLQEWDSLFVDGGDRIVAMITRGAERLAVLTAQGYRFETFSHAHRLRQIQDLRKALTASYSCFMGFTPISLEQFTSVLHRLEPILDPDLFLLVYSPSGACVGFAVAFPDYPEAVRAMKGRNNLVGKISYRLKRDRHPRLNFYLGGITPEMERSGAGLGRAGFYLIIRRALDKGYRTVMLTLRVKGNKAHGLAARSGLTAQHEYALYEYYYGN